MLCGMNLFFLQLSVRIFARRPFQGFYTIPFRGSASTNDGTRRDKKSLETTLSIRVVTATIAVAAVIMDVHLVAVVAVINVTTVSCTSCLRGHN